MPISNYPNGFAEGVNIRGLPLLTSYPGQIYWVDSVRGSNGNKGTFDRPFGTIAYAITQTTASRGDIIVAKAGHAESVIAASTIAMSTAGVAVLGLGTGALRPTITFSTATTATLTMSAASCVLHNLLFIGGIDALVSPIVVSAADNAIINCEYRDTAATQCTDCILTTAGANRLLVQNFRYDGDTAAGTNAGIAIVGGDRITIDGLWMDGNFAVAGIDVRTTATTDLEVRNAQFRNRTAAGVGSEIFLKDTITGSTGMIGPNIYIRLPSNTTNITEAITGATFVVFDPVYVVNLANEKGFLINWTISADA